MNFQLKRLSVEDGKDIYDMLQAIPQDENGFVNKAYVLSYSMFREWLTCKNADSRQNGIIDG